MILVTGASGLTGSAVVRRLSARGIPVRALVRDPGRAGGITALPGVQVAVGDFSRPGTLDAALDGVERAFLVSSSNASMVDDQVAFVDAGRRSGLAHVVKLSGIMPERDSAFRFARMHGRIEQAIEESGIPFTHLRAGEFMASYFRQIPNIAEKGVIALPLADARVASIDTADLADVAVEVLTGMGHEGAVYPLTGPEALTMADVAERLSAAIGREVRYVDISPTRAYEAWITSGIPPYLADGLGELFAERRAGKEGTVFPTTTELLGRPATSFAEFATRNAAAFKGEETPVPT